MIMISPCVVGITIKAVKALVTLVRWQGEGSLQAHEGKCSNKAGTMLRDKFL